MRYELALQLWGAMKVAQHNRLETNSIALPSVKVNFDFDEGYSCCGGSNPNCYCSFAQSPSANVVVSAWGKNGRRYGYTMDLESFDFVTVLGEICNVGEGNITS